MTPTRANDQPAPPTQLKIAYVPTGRLSVVLLLVAGLYLLLFSAGSNIASSGLTLLAINAAIFVVLIADTRSLPPAGQLIGRRSHAAIFSLAVPEQLTVTVMNTSDHAVAGPLRLPLPASISTAQDTVQVTIPAQGIVEVPFTLVAKQRGRHKCLPLELRAKSRLGLVVKRFLLCPQDEIVVYPNVKEAKRWQFAVRKRRDDPGLRNTRVLGIGTDFESLREYRPDDDFRLIDWRATARKGTPISRQYRVERNQNILFVVDTGRLMAAPVNDLTRLDLALNAATAMAYVCASLDDNVGLLAFDSQVQTQYRPGRRQGNAIMSAMSKLQPSPVESDYDLAFRIAGSMKRSLIVLFIDLMDETVSAPLIAAVPTLARHHLVVTASVTDPDITDAARMSPHDEQAALRQAVAIDTLRNRRQVRLILNSLGVEVIDAPPERFSPALIDAYLRLKQRI